MSLPNTIPILKLAFIPLEMILQQIAFQSLGYYILEDIANLSNRCYRIVQLVKNLPLTGFLLIKINGATILTYMIGEQNVARHFFVIRYVRYHNPFWAERSDKKFENYKNDEHIHQEIKRTIDLFRRPVSDVCYTPSKDLRGGEVNYENAVEKCERLAIYAKYPMRNEIMKHLLINCSATKWLKLEHKMKEDFEMDLSELKPTSIMFSGEHHWIKGQNILKAKAHTMKIEKCSLTLQDLEMIVSTWMKGDKELECLELQLKDAPTEELNLKIFNPKEWDPKTRREVFPNPFPSDTNFSLAKGLDIERSDGLLATVLLEKDRFIFVVWKDRFPVIPGMKEEENEDEEEEDEEDEDYDEEESSEDEDEDEEEEEEEGSEEEEEEEDQ